MAWSLRAWALDPKCLDADAFLPLDTFVQATELLYASLFCVWNGNNNYTYLMKLLGWSELMPIKCLW